MATLLQQLDEDRKQQRLADREAARSLLRESLHQLIPGRKVIVFGSLTQAGKFNRCSDIDIALDSLPDGMSPYTLTALLEEAMRRPVDVILLAESRLREKILAEGETWTA